MVNTRLKMQTTNKIIKKKLVELGWTDIHTFPHMRFSKDYTIDGEGFDAFGWTNIDDKNKIIWFLQYKSNLKCPKKIMKKYIEIESKRMCKCAWITKIDRKGVFMFTTLHPKGIRL